MLRTRQFYHSSPTTWTEGRTLIRALPSPFPHPHIPFAERNTIHWASPSGLVFVLSPAGEHTTAYSHQGFHLRIYSHQHDALASSSQQDWHLSCVANYFLWTVDEIRRREMRTLTSVCKKRILPLVFPFKARASDDSQSYTLTIIQDSLYACAHCPLGFWHGELNGRSKPLIWYCLRWNQLHQTSRVKG